VIAGKGRHWFSFSVLFCMTMTILEIVAIMFMLVMIILMAITSCGYCKTILPQTGLLQKDVTC